MKDELKWMLKYGRDKARKSTELQMALGAPDREIRLCIRQLIADGLPIASSTDGRTGGYFIANTQEEAKEYMGKLRSRIIQDCLRYRDFKLAARPLLYPGQLPLVLA